MKIKKNEFVSKKKPNLHVLSQKSQKKFKKLTDKKSLISTTDGKVPLFKDCYELKKDKLKEKLKKKLQTRTSEKKPPLVISMPSTSQSCVPHLLTGEANKTAQSQPATSGNISELISPNQSGNSVSHDFQKSHKRVKKSKKRNKSKFKIEDVETYGYSNTSARDFNSQLNSSSSAIDYIDPRAVFYELDDSKVLLTIQQSCSIYFCGILTVSVLRGAVEVLGFTVEPNGSKYTVFSPQGSSSLCLTGVSSSCNYPTVNELINLGMKKSIADKVLEGCASNMSFVVLEKGMTQALRTKFMYFVERYCKFPVFPGLVTKGSSLSNAERFLQCALYNNTNSTLRKEFNVVPKWLQIKEDVLNFSESNPKVVLCGGKAVGKSTLLRYFVNTMLKKYEKVVVIDCDIGQSEFTIPGCVSIVVVKEPLLGPSYTHFIKPKRCIFLGEINVTQCPEKYFKSIQYIFDYCNSKEELKNIPWFVNTMGYCRGFGVMLTSCLIQRFGPTHLVQISSKDRNRNFPSWLTTDVVDKQCTGVFATAYNPLNYQFYVVPSEAEHKARSSKNQWGMHPPLARDILILSYVAQMLKPPVVDINEVVPYEVNISDLNLELIEETLPREQILSSMNGSLVALCKTDEDICLCLGFGIVRGIDTERDKLYMITPLSMDVLKGVNTLVKSGNVALPGSMYLDQGNNITGPVPYVSVTSGRTPTRVPKIEFRPLNENLGTTVKDY